MPRNWLKARVRGQLGRSLCRAERFSTEAATKIAIVLAAFLGQPPAQAQSNTIGFTLAGTCDLGTPAEAFALNVSVAGDYAFLACPGVGGGGMLVIDVHDPAQPTVSGRLPTEGWAFSVRVRGRYAYVTELEAGLQIIDVSDPSSPTLVAAWKTVGRAGEICLVGDYAYVATGESLLDPAARDALEIIDVSNPEHPMQAGCFYTEGWGPHGLDVVGRYAYLAKENFLQVIEVSNPARPFLAGVFGSSDGSDGFFVSGVRVVGDYAYVTSEVWDPVLQRYVWLFRVLNVTDPTRPVEAGRCDVEYVTLASHSLEVVGHYAYVPMGQPENAEYGIKGLAVIDVSNPTTPVRVGTFEPPHATWANYTQAAQIVGRTAYLASSCYFYIARISFPLRLEAASLPDKRLRLSWLGSAGVRLQQTTSLVGPDWQDLPDSEGRSSLELPMTDAMAFFRLVQR